MLKIATTPPSPPYYVVIFTSKRSQEYLDNPSYQDDYAATIKEMLELAAQSPGFLGVETARDKVGLNCSYWKDYESIVIWRNNARHKIAQHKGKKLWYSEFMTRVGLIEKQEDNILDAVFLPS
jgi:heme-degrading monooxygenase HmoA